MAAQKLTVVARIRAKPGKEEQVKRELLKLLAPTHVEEGCINYDMHASVDNPAHFLFHENWTSRAALDKHLQSDHVQVFFRQMDELLAEPVDITFWHQVD